MLYSEKIEKVAIIGTGIAGLGMAACLKHFNTGVKEVIVFDPHDDILEYNKGGALGLSGGSVVMDRIGCLSELQRYSHRIDHISFNYKDHVLFDFDTEELKKSIPKLLLKMNDDEHLLTYTCRWSTLRKVLYDHSLRSPSPKKSTKLEDEYVESNEMKDLIPERENEEEFPSEEDVVDEIQVKYVMNKRFRELYEHPGSGKVSLIFEDGSTAEEFDLVIGADGVKSTVRNYTSFPHETYLASLPFGRWFAASKGPQYTGMHVTQCITPLRKDVHPGMKPQETSPSDISSSSTDSANNGRSPSSVVRMANVMNHHPHFHSQQQQQQPDLIKDKAEETEEKGMQKEDKAEDRKGTDQGNQEESSEEKKSPLKRLGSSGRIARARSNSISLEPTHSPAYDTIVTQFSNRFSRYLGDACDLLVLTLGENENTHYALIAIYAHPENHSFTSWRHPIEQDAQIAILRQRLEVAGFASFHMNFQAFIDVSQFPGGMIFDVAVDDFICPLRSWTSTSGRVLLIGDSAHAMSPFLGQGANQALQDAFCLCNLIYQHNHHGTPSPLWEDVHSTTSISLLQALVRFVIGWMIFLLHFVMRYKPTKPYVTKMQLLAQDYERIRKFHCFLITLGARFVGMLETLRVPLGLWIKVIIFGFLGRTGLIKLLFLNPMKPVV